MSDSGLSPRNDPEAVLGDAAWLPAHIDAARGALELLYLPRSEHAGVTFLSDEYLKPKDLPVASLPFAALASVSPPEKPAHFIFHSALCCSTLLARALDVPGISMGLKEPRLLIELADLFRQRRLGAAQVQAFARLLSRPFAPGEAVVIKPGNEANILADALLAGDSRSKALLLYAPLPRFLASVARKGMWGRLWVRRLFKLLRGDGGAQLGFGEAELHEQTDLQLAALAWLLHHDQFARMLARYPDRVRILDSDSFLAQRKETLMALARHFGLAADAARWDAVVQGGTFGEHSKELGRAFGGGADAADLRGMPEALGTAVTEEIEMVVKWAEAVAGHAGVPLDMPAASRLLTAR